MEVFVGEGAKLNFVELQSLGIQEWNFTHEKVNVYRDAEVDWIFGALGSHVTKNFSDLNLVGQGSTGKMSGFYFTNGSQHLDHDTQQNHLAPNTTSDLLFKGALLVESRSVWQGMIYSPLTGIAGLVTRAGFPVPNPLTQPSTALYGIAVVDLWHWWGFLCVIFFAALRQVPQEQIEAARIEGASFWQMLRYVLLPGIRPTITLMMIMTIIWSFLVFDFVYILTQGGPAFSSEVLSTLAYRSAFYDLAVGKAAAVAVVISLFGLATTAVYIRLQAKEFDQ